MMRRVFLLLYTSILILGPDVAFGAWVGIEESIMGTRIQVQVWHDDEATGREAAQAVIDEMHRIDRLMSTYKPDSEISEINAAAARGPVKTSQELFDLIALSLDMAVLTGGAFDITYASVGYLYDFRARQRPNQNTLEQSLPAVDFRHVTLDPEALTVQFAREGVRIDLGGIAKGYAVECGIQLIRGYGIEHGLVSAGGDTRVLGDRRGRPWHVGIRDPRGEESEVIALLPLENEAISTSGDYERYFEEDGVRYHHIIEPGSGRSATGVRSVTVVGPNATRTDALSTSVFVLGVDEGLALVDSLDDIEAVIVDEQGRMFYSAGFDAPSN